MIDGWMDGCDRGGGRGGRRGEGGGGKEYMNATDGSLKFSVNCSSKQTKQQDICLPAGVSVFLGASLSRAFARSSSLGQGLGL